MVEQNANIAEERVHCEPHGKLFIAAKIISAVFTPLMVPLLSFFLLFFFTYLRALPMAYKLTVLGMIYCFTIMLPVSGIYLFRKISGWKLYESEKRERRYIPYFLTAVSYLACLIVMYRIHMPCYMNGIVAATLVCIVICAVVNSRWRVSTHMAGGGLMVGGLLSFSFIFRFNPVWMLCFFILLSGVLGSARIIVRQHSLGEVGGGFLIGLFCSIIEFLFIRI